MTNTQNTWTDENIAILRKMHIDGLSYSEIGKKLGISRNAALGKGHRLGLSTRAASPPKGVPRTTTSTLKRAVPTTTSSTKVVDTPIPVESQKSSSPIIQEVKKSTTENCFIGFHEFDPKVHCGYVIGTKWPTQYCGQPRTDDRRNPYCANHTKQLKERAGRK